jgi:hypothetical protein
MNRGRRGELPWTNIDALHRMVLDELRVKYDITSLSKADKDYLNRVWHRKGLARRNTWPHPSTPDLMPSQAFTVHAVDFNDLAAKPGV